VLVVAVVSLGFGIVVGGNLFSRSQPRSIIALRSCDRCWTLADLVGLLGSLGMQRFRGAIPVVFETDRTIALRHPLDRRLHYVIVPKKDLKDIRDLSASDAGYVIDAYLVARHLIEKDHLTKYRFYTNGPDNQTGTYLHFHLIKE
jgi:hypothetical protein